MTTTQAQQTTREHLNNFRQHSEAMDRAVEQTRPYSYLYSGGGHCPFNWNRIPRDTRKVVSTL